MNRRKTLATTAFQNGVDRGKPIFIGFFCVGGQMKEHGLYIIKDDFLKNKEFGR